MRDYVLAGSFRGVVSPLKISSQAHRLPSPAMKPASGRLLLPALLLSLSGAASGQDTPGPTPRAGDVGSIDSIISTLYAVISGPVGQPRQWERFLSLMHPQARLMPTRCPAAPPCTLRVLSPEEYRQAADSFLVSQGFRERELVRRVERYGAIAHAFSSYASLRRDETTPFARGINSIQLFWDGRRWWILAVFWDSERPGNPLPADFQGSGN